MGDNDKTFDSSSNTTPKTPQKGAQTHIYTQSRAARDRAWIQLTWKYLNDLPQQLDGIRTILEIKDYSTIKKRAHQIKGTSGTYHLETISKSAAQMERLAEHRNHHAISSVINKVSHLIELETKRFGSRLQNFANELPTNSQTASPQTDSSERPADG
jgi:HPt (histidine-containing phosphotransfer) domain-containing protein